MINQQKSTNGMENVPVLLITAADFAKMMELSERTLARRCAEGAVPLPVRIGGSVRWRRREIEAWIEAGCPHPSSWEYRRDS